MADKDIFSIGLLLFPGVTQLDLTAPWEVFSGLPDTRTHLVWKTREPVAAAKGMRIVPDTTFSECPQLDLICIPGGPGMNALLTDRETLDFIRAQAHAAKYITSVCTGSLVLGAAGLLHGKRAASHWMSRHMLACFGATPVNERVVVDGNVITGGGVTAGIDFALRVVAELKGERVAQSVQLGIEYAPAPPFNAGSPELAPPEVVQALQEMARPMQTVRQAQVDAAALALRSLP
jgi:cyclohexyl-isocyanide hydratase